MHILFVCTGNTCRSPMAQLLCQHALPHKTMTVQSAGIYAMNGQPATDAAIGAMASHGLDLRPHTAKQLTPQMVEEADLVLAMTASHQAQIIAMAPHCKHKVFTLLGYATGENSNIADPFGGDLAIYQSCATELSNAIQKLKVKIDIA